jgi:hypothetical protein
MIMSIDAILRWIVIAVVLTVAVALLSVLLQIGAFLLNVAVKALLALLVIAVALRLVSYVRRE